MIIDETDHLAHYGILRRSGRYPWGSGGTQESRNRQFLDYISDMKGQGLSEAEIARGVGLTTTQLRAAKTMAKNQQKQSDIAMAQRLKDKGYSNVAIGERMGINESSVRSLLAPGAKDKADLLVTTSDMLKRQVDEKGFIDVGIGVENHIGVSKEKLNVAIAMLKEQGYEVHTVKVKQLGTGFDTEVKVLAPPGTTQRDVFMNRADIRQITEMSDDGGRNFYGLHDPISVNPKRVSVLYDEDGGSDADGVIYVRRGVEDLSLGNANYAQVRIKVGDSHYLKGMAMYKDDLPDGVDLVFNTNKPKGTPMMGPKDNSVLKGLSDDPDNPFGAVVRQLVVDKGGPNERVVSAMNIVNEEGDWGRWSKNLSSQMLSKQSPRLIKDQLDITYERRKKELEAIQSLTNPTVRKKLLEDYADSTDSASVHLKAAALPRQASHVILPINSLSPTQIYAPNYRDGERVVLIRYPHGGTFEIPELTVNNRHSESKRLLGQAKDAVGINSDVAKRLSGADFDGDTVLVIPNNSRRVAHSRPLDALKDFDPQRSYKGYEGMPKLSPDRKQQLMGDVSNLITDMTIKGASHSDIARAVRHSMVVIDAEKHNLNYKQSAIDNGIKQLKAQYQGGPTKGASTIISRAQATTFVNERKLRPASEGGPVDLATGRKVYVETGRTTSSGAPKLQRSKKLAEVDDAHELSSGTPTERLYADHSNRLKSLANQARLESVNTPPLRYSPSAKKAYSEEVSSLDAKLSLAKRNAPLERQAQVLANAQVQAKKQADPNMEFATRKKIEAQALNEARARTGAGKQRIEITQREWDAIQAGAISDHKLGQILNNANMDNVRTLATPRPKVLMTSTNTRRAQAMLAAGRTRAEVADALGVSLSTLDVAINE